MRHRDPNLFSGERQSTLVPSMTKRVSSPYRSSYSVSGTVSRIIEYRKSSPESPSLYETM